MKKHLLTFFPLGNADTTLIELASGKTILWDYANMRDPNDEDDKRINLSEELNKRVSNDFDVVCFTHADKDHIHRFSEYFYLQHAQKYQGEGRKRINELWVPAAILLDGSLDDEAKILKAEVRCRLKAKEGILIFSRPKKMKDWCNQQDDISYEDVKHLFVDAGKLVPGFSKLSEGVEFFVHSPFVSERKDINRNDEAIIVQATFDDECQSKVMLGSDATHKLWKDIVEVTRYFGNEDKLVWDLFHLSHHCSYLSIGPEKGDSKTEPIDEVKWLLETQSRDRCRIISPSCPIPSKDSQEDDDCQPPHRQAAAYYKGVVNTRKGEFLVTMEEPSTTSPKPIEFEITGNNCMKKRSLQAGASTFVHTRKAERAGHE